MKVPVTAVIAREKLTEYLLVFRVKSDKSQFLAQAGFTIESADQLEQAIKQHIS